MLSLKAKEDILASIHKFTSILYSENLHPHITIFQTRRDMSADVNYWSWGTNETQDSEVKNIG